jgi:retron-type reverse transcriptase
VRTKWVKVTVRIGGEIKMEKRVKQGDSLSPLLFIIVIDQILKQCKRGTARCKVGNYKMTPIYVQSLIYADEIALIVSNKEELQKAVTEWASAIEGRGIRINVKKSKVMVITKTKNREHLNITWE